MSDKDAREEANGNVRDFDVTHALRERLKNAGIDFTCLAWRDTEMLVEDAILPLRNEIRRLRGIVKELLAAESQRTQAPSLSLINLLTNVCQILDVVKIEWGETNAWSEWDQSVRDEISEYLKNYYEGKLTGTQNRAALTSCKARSANVGANDPQDCDWPFCGCDPAADKVLETLQESGVCLKRNCGTQAQAAQPMVAIPKGTVVFEPDDINRVSLMFPSQNDAIMFFELVNAVAALEGKP
jgi:hypothetical protein